MLPSSVIENWWIFSCFSFLKHYLLLFEQSDWGAREGTVCDDHCGSQIPKPHGDCGTLHWRALEHVLLLYGHCGMDSNGSLHSENGVHVYIQNAWVIMVTNLTSLSVLLFMNSTFPYWGFV